MEKSTYLVFLFSVLLLSQCCNCKKRQKRLTEFLIPNINLGDIALDSFKNHLYGAPVDKDQILIDKQLEQMEITSNIYELTQDIATAAQDAPELTVLFTSMQKLPEYFDKIDDAFNQYENYESLGLNASDPSVHQFAVNSKNRYFGPMSQILNLYAKAVPRNENGAGRRNDYSVVSLFVKFMKGFDKLCDKFRSQQQLVEGFYSSIAAAEFKTFMVLEYSHRILAQVNETNYEREVTTLRNNLETRFKRLIGAFKVLVAQASREVWRCDPEEFIEGTNYFSLFLFMSYIVRESDVEGAEHSCSGSCNDLKKTRDVYCTNDRTYWDSRVEYFETRICANTRPCSGYLFDCEDKFAAYSELWTCPSSVSNSHRRYDYLEHGTISKVSNTKDLRRYGMSESEQRVCDKDLAYNIRDYDGSFRVCESCLCTCQESILGGADMKVNLRPVIVDQYYVMTGVRWALKNHVLSIQIQQGQALPEGKVNVSTLSWKPVVMPRNESEYIKLDWENLRGFLLEDVTTYYQAVVGVKLIVVENDDEKFVSLAILATPYLYNNGKMYYGFRYITPDQVDEDSLYRDLWTKPYRLPNVIPEHEYVDLRKGGRVPTDTLLPSEPVPFKYVKLTTSDFESDIGQNTVPFFDMQENEVYPPTPIEGIGIYLKKREDYAGFLALKMITFDIRDFLEKEI